MDKHSYKQNAYYLMYLIRCVLKNQTPAKEKLDKMDLSGVFAVAKAHSLTAIAAYALESASIYDKDFEEEKNKAIRKTIILDAERENVLAELEKAGIWYMPLKGIIIKDLYPQIGMRQMGDNDILIDNTRQKDIKEIMLSNGFRVESYNISKHDVYYKDPVSNFQMHVSLFDKNEKDPRYCYFKEIEKRIISDSNSNYGRAFTDEDFYLYIKAHEYKHYSTGGTGIRSIVDTYMILTHFINKLNMNYIETECEKIGIAEYEKQSRELAMHLLGGKKLSVQEQQMLDYIIFSGTYGTFENVFNNNVCNHRNINLAKMRYIWSRLSFPISKSNVRYIPYSQRYNWFYKNKARLPLLFFYRIGLALTSSRNKSKAELNALRKI
ncbi:MAG: nucleotidyltransferase family protein [Ruminococcus sp.]|nr:nucleotidyltransferase family protein [Ruminococcus sp.]